MPSNNETMYQVGEYVIVRPDLQEGDEHNNCLVVDDMDLLAGETVRITSAWATGAGARYKIYGSAWNWSDNMFLPHIEERPLDFEESDFESLLQ